MRDNSRRSRKSEISKPTTKHFKTQGLHLCDVPNLKIDKVVHGERPFTLHAMGQNYQFLLTCCPVIKVSETSNRLFQKIMLPSETTKITFFQTRATIGSS